MLKFIVNESSVKDEKTAAWEWMDFDIFEELLCSCMMTKRFPLFKFLVDENRDKYQFKSIYKMIEKYNSRSTYYFDEYSYRGSSSTSLSFASDKEFGNELHEYLLNEICKTDEEKKSLLNLKLNQNSSDCDVEF